MSFCTYIASDCSLEESPLLWHLSLGAQDIYTEKKYVAQIEPGLEDLSGVTDYICSHLRHTDEVEVWHIWQGIESEPIIRSWEIPVFDFTVDDLKKLIEKDVFATATQYDIPVQYRLVIKKR